MNHKTDLFHCPVEAVLSLISGKYKCIILWGGADKKLDLT